MIEMTYQVSLGGAVVFDQSSSSYQLLSISPAGVRRRRVTVTAPDVHGAAELASVLDEASYGMLIRCYGTDMAGAQSLIDAIAAAVGQRSWVLGVTLDGSSRSWQARAADWVAALEPGLAWRGWRDVTLTVPVAPVSS